MAKGEEHGGVGVEDRGTTRQQRDGRARTRGAGEGPGGRWGVDGKNSDGRGLYIEKRVAGSAERQRHDGGTGAIPERATLTFMQRLANRDGWR